MIRLESTPLSAAYAPGESIAIRLRIINDGAQPVELAHPTRVSSREPSYSLEGPSFPNGKSFSPASAVIERGDEDLVARANPIKIHIEPNSVWEDTLKLQDFVVPAAVGAYRLSFSYSFDGKLVQSTAASFRLVTFEPVSSALAQGTEPGKGGGVFALRSSAELSLYSFEFDELRTDTAEVKLSIRQRLTVPGIAADFLVSSKNFPYGLDEARFIAWREGALLKALSIITPDPISLDSGRTIDALIAPALETASGPFEVLGLARDRSELFLASIEHAAGQPRGFKISWARQLPAAALEAAVTLGPESLGSPRYVTTVWNVAGGMDVFCARFGKGIEPTVLRSVHVPGVRVQSGFRPSLSVDARNGHLLFSIIVGGPSPAPLSIVDLEWDEHGTPSKSPKVFLLHTFPGVATSGSVLLRAAEGSQPIQKEVVLANEKHEAYTVKRAGKLHQRTTSLLPALPLLLVAGKERRYFLASDPQLGLNLESVD